MKLIVSVAVISVHVKPFQKQAAVLAARSKGCGTYFLAQQGLLQPGSQILPDLPRGATSNWESEARNGVLPV